MAAAKQHLTKKWNVGNYSMGHALCKLVVEIEMIMCVCMPTSYRPAKAINTYGVLILRSTSAYVPSAEPVCCHAGAAIMSLGLWQCVQCQCLGDPDQYLRQTGSLAKHI